MHDSSQISVENQTHLGYAQRINLGSYYTKNEYVSIVWDMIVPLLENNSVVLDTSCGYGNFLRPMDGLRVVGNDIDPTATMSKSTIDSESKEIEVEISSPTTAESKAQRRSLFCRFLANCSLFEQVRVKNGGLMPDA